MEQFKKIFKNHNLQYGRLISSSKSAYANTHSHNAVIFNAKIYDIGTDGSLIWSGDLDLTLDLENLIGVSRELRTELVVTFESAIFENNLLDINDTKHLNKIVFSTIYGVFDIYKKYFIYENNVSPKRLYLYSSDDEISNNGARLKCGNCVKYDYCLSVLRGKSIVNDLCKNYEKVEK